MKHFSRAAALGVLLLLSIGGLAQDRQQPDENPAYLYIAASTGGCRAELIFSRRPLVSASRLGRALSRALGTAPANWSRELGHGDDGWWSIVLRAHGAPATHGLTQQVRLDPGPLYAILEQEAATSLRVKLKCPDMPTTRVTGGARIHRVRRGVYTTEYFPSGEGQEPLTAVWGYRAADALLMLAAAGMLLAVAAALIVRARRRALAAPPELADTAWFAFYRSGQMLAVYIWAGWALLATASGWCGLASIAGAFLGCRGTAASGVLVLLPPAVSALLMARLAFPVVQRVRGAQWTAADLVKQTALRVAVAFVPAGLYLVALYSFIDGDPRAGVVGLVLAYASYLGFALALGTATDMTPHALTTGALRDRVFELAAQAKVRVSQFYLLPAGRGLMSNAGAATGGRAMVTERLVRGLVCREVDAVLAHEVAHLRLRHPRKLSIVFLAALIVFLLALSALFRGVDPDRPVAIPVAIIVGYAAMLAASRRFERSADCLAVKLTGDPEALISGLAKLVRQNMLPMDWTRAQEQTLTHPSTLRRATYIGKLGGIAPERVQALLAGAQLTPRHEDEDPNTYYPVPSLDQRQPLFSSRYRAISGLRVSWTMLAALAVVPACLVMWAPGLGAAYWPLAVVLGVAGASAGYALIGARGFCRIGEQLRERWQSDGLPGGVGAFVGLSPSAERLTYDGWYDWDCGILWLSPNRLIYKGEQAAFATPRECICSVRCSTTLATWLRRSVVVIEWADTETGAGGVLQMRMGSPRTLWGASRQSRSLADAIEAWRSGAQEPRELVVGDESLAWPADVPMPDMPRALMLGEVTSKSPRETARRGLFVSLVYVGLVAMGVSVMFGLSLDPDDAVTGWLIVGAALLGWIGLQAPLLLGRKQRGSAGRT